MNIHSLDAASFATFVEVNRPNIVGDVLDVGCGSMPYKRLFPDAKWTGIDLRPVGDVVGDVHEMPFDDASFDTVLCVNAFAQFFDPCGAFGEMVRVLRPGGHLLICTYNTHQDDDVSLWDVKARGLYLLATAAGLEAKIETFSHLWEMESENFWQTEKFGMALPESWPKWVRYLEKAYPHMSMLVGKKV